MRDELMDAPVQSICGEVDLLDGQGIIASKDRLFVFGIDSAAERLLMPAGRS
jgi:hypothetical protein